MTSYIEPRAVRSDPSAEPGRSPKHCQMGPPPPKYEQTKTKSTIKEMGSNLPLINLYYAEIIVFYVSQSFLFSEISVGCYIIYNFKRL